MLSPHLFRLNRYNVFGYDGTLLGEVFADNARDAAVRASAGGYRVAYARIPAIGGR